MESLAPILRVSNVSKRFGGVQALRGVTFDVAQRSISGVIGPNGAGKTSLFNVLTGLYAPEEGAILFGNPPEALSGLRPDQIAAKGIVRNFQAIRLFREMTVLENLQVAQHSHITSNILDILRRSRHFTEEEAFLERKSEEWLRFVGLGDCGNHLAGSLAYGKQRLLEIARALAAGPKLLLLDEPVAGMNPSETAALVPLFRKIRDLGVTLLLIEHDMKLVMDLCERIVVLDYGEKIAEGPPEAIATDPAVIEAYLGRKPARAARA